MPKLTILEQLQRAKTDEERRRLIERLKRSDTWTMKAPRPIRPAIEDADYAD